MADVYTQSKGAVHIQVMSTGVNCCPGFSASYEAFGGITKIQVEGGRKALAD